MSQDMLMEQVYSTYAMLIDKAKEHLLNGEMDKAIVILDALNGAFLRASQRYSKETS